MMQDLDPRVQALLHEGVAQHSQSRLDAARALYEQVLQLQPGNSRAWHLLGVVALQTGRLHDALALIGKALALDPLDAGAHDDYGMALLDLGRYEAAIASFDRAIGLNSDHARAHNHRGSALHALGQIRAALASHARAISIAADYADAHSNRGNVLFELERFAEALLSYDRVIALQPNFADAHNNRGNVLYELGEVEAALACYDRALALQPSYPGVHFNRAQMLDALGRHAAAAASYNQVLALEPDFKFARGHRLLARMQICDWREYDVDIADLTARVERGEPVASPFSVLALSGSAALQRQAAQIWVRHKAPPDGAPAPIAKRSSGEKIRIGYFSADFRNHPVSCLTVEMFETHDRSKFEVTAISFGPDTRDEMRQRLEKAFDRFVDVHTMSTVQIAALARTLEIDIAVDLTGFTTRCRPGIFALRAAPIQVSYIGYLGTMGAPYIDYLITDTWINPPAQRSHYHERLACLPSYQANDSKRRVADRTFSRQELGLPPTGFVFCCFNANFKITPATFDSWMRILTRTPGAVLFLYAASDTAAANLRREARSRGVDADRLVFGQRLPAPDYLARYKAADLFLDTLPYNAGTTASDALWVGLPVLTCAGESFAGRVGTSLLHAIRLPELVTANRAQYEESAVALATDPQRMAAIKHKLAQNRRTTPLFDTLLHTRGIEAAYRVMHARHQADLPPEDLFI